MTRYKYLKSNDQIENVNVVIQKDQDTGIGFGGDPIRARVTV